MSGGVSFTSKLRSEQSATIANIAQPFTQIVDRVQQEKRNALAALAGTLVRQIKIYLSFPGRGRIYKRARVTRAGKIKKLKSGRTSYLTHQASAPGQPPAVDLGTLRNSIAMQEIRAGVFRVGTNVDYAPPLEFGAPPHLAARPFMRPALASVKLWWKRDIVTALQRGAKKR